MKRLFATLALLGVFALGQTVQFHNPTRWTFPSLLDLFAPPIYATYRPTVFKSVQRGTITLASATSNTATITSVDTANTLLFWTGTTVSATSAIYDSAFVRLALTNATTITATQISTATSNVVGYEVCELYAGVLNNVQRGTISVSGATTNTATITSVTTAKSVLTSLGWTGANSSGDGALTQTMGNLALTNATTVTASRQGTLNTIVAGYQVAEYK